MLSGTALPLSAMIAALIVGFGARGAAAQANLIECRELAQRYSAARQSAVDRQLNIYLSQAAQKGCADLTLELIKDGASVRARRREGDTALHHAVKARDRKSTRLNSSHLGISYAV